jgi:hypothetical protein
MLVYVDEVRCLGRTPGKAVAPGGQRQLTENETFQAPTNCFEMLEEYLTPSRANC